MNRIICAVVLLLGVGIAAGVASGQPRYPGEPGEMGHGGQRDAMMQRMMEQPHHKLVMAYRETIQTFAQALKSHVSKTGRVEKGFGKTVLAEINRSLAQMKKHHEEQKRLVSAEMRPQMERHIRMMEERFAALQQQVDSLEREVKADVPDPRRVVAAADQVVKECEMMKMPRDDERREERER